MVRIFRPFMSSGVFTSRWLFVMLRKPFSDSASVRMPVALRMSSVMSRMNFEFMNSHATGEDGKRYGIWKASIGL